jgi:hypothetical protein
MFTPTIVLLALALQITVIDPRPLTAEACAGRLAEMQVLVKQVNPQAEVISASCKKR